jgi:membrane-associated phospholipid phosphatase
LIGYWDGSMPVPAMDRPDDLTRLMRLQPYSRAVVLAHEALSLFSVRPGANGSYVLRGESDLVGLTPPGPAKLVEQMADLRSAMDLRADRLVEIIAQSNDLLSFFFAQMQVTPTRRPYTTLLIAAFYETVTAQEQRIKHFCSIPRPVDLSSQVQPMIETPGHSAYPSGHATEAFGFATLLAALRLAGAGTQDSALLETILAKLTPVVETASDTDAIILLYRLAARIADNRTIAGLHYPVDSAHGGLLGLGVGLGFVAHCLGGGPSHPVPEWSARGDDWPGDFSLRKWCAALGGTAPQGWRSGSTTVPEAESWHILPRLWAAAVAEWSPTGPAEHGPGA